MIQIIRTYAGFLRLGDALLVFFLGTSLVALKFIPDPEVRSYAANVSASFLFAGILRSVELYRESFRHIRFVEFFGGRIASNQFSLVYPEFTLRPRVYEVASQNGLQRQELFEKSSRIVGDEQFRVDLPSCAATNDLLAITEMTAFFGKQLREPIRICPDSAHSSLQDECLMSFGLSSNQITHHWLRLLRLSSNCVQIVEDPTATRYKEFIRVKSSNSGPNATLDFKSTADNEIGIIAKFRPDDDQPELIWFFCAGLGPAATIGCSAYLARKWPKLLKRFGSRDFVLIIRTQPGVEHHSRPTYGIQDCNGFELGVLH